MFLLLNPVFQTVITGVLIFVIGQIFQNFFLQPLQELKKVVGKIDYQLKFSANVYTSSLRPQEDYNKVSESLRDVSCELETNFHAVPSCMISLLSFFGVVPSKEKLLNQRQI